MGSAPILAVDPSGHVLEYMKGVMSAVGSGIWDQFTGMIGSAWDMVTDPIGTIMGMLDGVVQLTSRIADGDFMGFLGEMFPGIANFLRSLEAPDGCLTEYEKGEALGEMLMEVVPMLIPGGGGIAQVLSKFKVFNKVGKAAKKVKKVVNNVKKKAGDTLKNAKCRLTPGSKRCFVAGTIVLMGSGAAIPIESIEVGDRVETTYAESTAIDGETTIRDESMWRKITLEMPDKDNPNDIYEVVLLRPLGWLDQQHARVGAEVPIAFSEVEIAGIGRILAIDQCPPIASGSGRVVTATYNHLNPLVIDIGLSMGETVTCTAPHRFYSADRKAWVPTRHLRLGEHLVTSTGTTKVTSLNFRPGAYRVYNLEVDLDHTYYVTNGGLLTHNGCHGNSKKSNKSQHGYVVIDMETKQIVKVGVSGGKINKNGTSRRAQKQVREWNKIAGGDRYRAQIVKRIEPQDISKKGAPTARERILDWEREGARELKRFGELSDTNFHELP